MKLRNALLLTVLMHVAVTLIAQKEVKLEREKSISKEDFPASALHTIKPLMEPAKRIHYYLETGSGSPSYEVKFSYNKQKYSIEFDSTGQLLDIEVLMKWDDLPVVLMEEITKKLDNHWARSKVTRLQKQYRFIDTSIVLTDLPPSSLDGFVVAYELEVDVQQTKRSRLESYELLFDSMGELLLKRPIEKIALDNLIY